MEPLLQAIQDGIGMSHGEMRALVEGAPAEALNWRPGAETNSLAALVMHGTDQENWWIGTVLGTTGPRDRGGMFQVTVDGPEPLLQRIDEMDATMRAALPKITSAQLEQKHPFRGNQASGALLLIHTTQHLREHLAHMQLTWQLWSQAQGADAAG
jgi:hypothetical protein